MSRPAHIERGRCPTKADPNASDPFCDACLYLDALESLASQVEYGEADDARQWLNALECSWHGDANPFRYVLGRIREAKKRA